MTGKTAHLRQAILERIRSGTTPVGSKLPSLRTLASEFGVHSNTVSRVYSELAAEGIVRTVQGSGTFVVAVPDRNSSGGAVEELYRSLAELSVRARRLGLSRREWRRLADDAEATGFSEDGPTIDFVECSIRDADELAASLSTLLERYVRPVLVDDLPELLLLEDSEHFLITTPFHVEEVEEIAAGTHSVVTVNVVPRSETLVQFARFEPGDRIAVVSANLPTLHRIVRMIRTFTRIEPVAAKLVDEADVAVAVQVVDIVVDTQSIHERVVALAPDANIVTVRYQIEPTSLAYLREVLRRREAPGLEALGN